MTEIWSPVLHVCACTLVCTWGWGHGADSGCGVTFHSSPRSEEEEDKGTADSGTWPGDTASCCRLALPTSSLPAHSSARWLRGWPRSGPERPSGTRKAWLQQEQWVLSSLILSHPCPTIKKNLFTADCRDQGWRGERNAAQLPLQRKANTAPHHYYLCTGRHREMERNRDSRTKAIKKCREHRELSQKGAETETGTGTGRQREMDMEGDGDGSC